MRLSAPIYTLKRRAKTAARDQNIPLHQALDDIAQTEGFARWSLLASHYAARSPAKKLVSWLAPGEMLLIGARPGQGKTLLGLELLLEAARCGRNAACFTLEFTHQETVNHLLDIAGGRSNVLQDVEIETSDDISADYIVSSLGARAKTAVVMIDYLQGLDQSRTKPPLGDQLNTLHAFAKASGTNFVVLAQIDRAFTSTDRRTPDVQDIRTPNPFNPACFDKTCFLHGGELALSAQ